MADRKRPKFFCDNSWPVCHYVKKQSMRCLGDHPYVPFRNTVLPVPTDYTIFEILLSRCTGLLELLRGICAIVCPNGMNGL